jgi:hypothetical protein
VNAAHGSGATVARPRDAAYADSAARRGVDRAAGSA